MIDRVINKSIVTHKMKFIYGRLQDFDGNVIFSEI